jgi:uroporphyrinogen decarboxylase
MTSRERMLAAFRREPTDRVPVAPDISNMIPCKLQRKPFWEIYLNRNPSLGQAYMEACRYFGMDGWYTYAELDVEREKPVSRDVKILSKSEGRITARETIHTPSGDLSQVTVYKPADSPTQTEKMIKNLKDDFPKLRCLFGKILKYDRQPLTLAEQIVGDEGVVCAGVQAPGFQTYIELFDGGLENALFAYYDEPDLFMEFHSMFMEHQLRYAEMLIDAKVDSILTGGSGSLTLQSPELWERLSLPFLKQVTALCRQAGVVSGIHSCGKERHLIDVCSKETSLDYVNPLEIAPMGDCSLDSCKRDFGGSLCLMGNLHTTDVMLFGDQKRVRLESLKAIRDAGVGGGFVLSTGDQCGRDTPDGNLLEMVAVAKEFGTYPLDLDRINEEIFRIESGL